MNTDTDATTAGQEGPKGRGHKGSGTVVAIGHDTKKFRLRAVSAEKDAYAKFISKPVATKVSAAQIGLAIFIAGIQIITTGMVVGRYSYDNSADCGAGIWVSFISAFAAILTGWASKNPRYWKLHVAFALHIINTIATVFFLIFLFGGTIPSIRWRLGDALYGDNDSSSSSYSPSYPSSDKVSVPLMVTSLVLNSLMGSAALAQIVCSTVMTLMTGRSLCCGQSKIHGKVFELEVAGSETADGMVVVKKSGHKGNAVNLQGIPGIECACDIPPTYQESQVV